LHQNVYAGVGIWLKNAGRGSQEIAKIAEIAKKWQLKSGRPPTSDNREKPRLATIKAGNREMATARLHI
jgi:hypothetical protein